jgi:hypothetical protein
MTAFGRPADQCGLAYWIGKLELGAPLEVVAEYFVQSVEFQTSGDQGDLNRKR